jgi:hypothetical protein
VKTGFLLFALFVFVIVALLAAANATWTSRTAEAVAMLEGSALAPPDSVFVPVMLEGLPAPVARYLRAALRDSVPLVRYGVVRQEGTFRGDSAQREAWDFRSVQHFGTRPAGFVWDARAHLGPGVDLFVRDALVWGEGSMLARLAATYPVVSVRGTPELAAASLQRWLAETAWFPTALLPGQAVTWTAVDDSTARATVTEGKTTASLDFHFGADSLVAYVRAGARGRMVGNRSVPTPWRGTWSDWRWRSGVRIPLTGEVEWELSSGPFVYWTGTVTDAVDE